MKAKCPACGHTFSSDRSQSRAGRASARRLTPEQRQARAAAAARARWAKSKPAKP